VCKKAKSKQPKQNSEEEKEKEDAIKVLCSEREKEKIFSNRR
jgi:hypothetical protein